MRFNGTPLLFHGTTHLDRILADGWLAAAVPRIWNTWGDLMTHTHRFDEQSGKAGVCFTRDPEEAVSFAFRAPWAERRPLHRAVLIFDRDQLCARYEINPIVSTIIYEAFGELEEKHEYQEEERIFAQKVLLEHGLLDIVEAVQDTRSRTTL